MARQTGLIKVKGKLDGLSFYEKDGQMFARKASSLSKNRIMTVPKYKRTRENMGEFSGCAKASRGFRRALGPVLGLADKKLVPRAFATYKKINLNGVGKRGKRSIDVSLNRPILKGFEINMVKVFEVTFKGVRLEATHVETRKSAQVIVPEFSPARDVVPVVGATHFRLIHTIGLVSDYAYDAVTSIYQPLTPAIEGVFASTRSEAFDVESLRVPSFNLSTAFADALLIPPNASVIQGIGIEFYQGLKDGDYPIEQSRSFKIFDVF